jgi:hypothetical protein
MSSFAYNLASPFETLFIKFLSSGELLTGAQKIPNRVFSREIMIYSKFFDVLGWSMRPALSHGAAASGDGEQAADGIGASAFGNGWGSAGNG